jgi:predicted phosphodiesterase
MRIALVSDIHGNLPALEAVVDDIALRWVDVIVNLGDSLSGPLLPLETAQYLMAAGWLSLAGNHDRQILSFQPGKGGPSDEYAHSQLTNIEFDWLRSLKPSVRLSEDVFLCHGTPRSDCEYFLESLDNGLVRLANSAEVVERLGAETSPVIACGHTHIQRAVRTSASQLVVNPGSVGLPAYEDVNPYPHVMETGSPDARYAIVEKHEKGWTAALFTVSYPHESMAKLAATRQRQDWVRALSSGYMS